MQELFIFPFDLENLGTRLASARADLGFSQHDFAMAIGVSRYTQIKYERASGQKDRTLPPLDYINRAYELGIDMQFVLTGKN